MELMAASADKATTFEGFAHKKVAVFNQTCYRRRFARHSFEWMKLHLYGVSKAREAISNLKTDVAFRELTRR